MDSELNSFDLDRMCAKRTAVAEFPFQRSSACLINYVNFSKKKLLKFIISKSQVERIALMDLQLVINMLN